MATFPFSFLVSMLNVWGKEAQIGLIWCEWHKVSVLDQHI
jgi:hypothetical protein